MHRNSHSQCWPLITVICWRFFHHNVKDCRHKFFVSCLTRFSREFLWEFSFFPRALFSFSGRSIISSHNMLQNDHNSKKYSLKFVGIRAAVGTLNEMWLTTFRSVIGRILRNQSKVPRSAGTACHPSQPWASLPKTIKPASVAYESSQRRTGQYRCQLECLACKFQIN